MERYYYYKCGGYTPKQVNDQGNACWYCKDSQVKIHSNYTSGWRDIARCQGCGAQLIKEKEN